MSSAWLPTRGGSSSSFTATPKPWKTSSGASRSVTSDATVSSAPMPMGTTRITAPTTTKPTMSPAEARATDTKKPRATGAESHAKYLDHCSARPACAVQFAGRLRRHRRNDVLGGRALLTDSPRRQRLHGELLGARSRDDGSVVLVSAPADVPLRRSGGHDAHHRRREGVRHLGA